MCAVTVVSEAVVRRSPSFVMPLLRSLVAKGRGFYIHGAPKMSVAHLAINKQPLAGFPNLCETMNDCLPTVYLARHGETAWSISGQHTGLTDLPLTARGERNARRLGERLKGLNFAKVFTSPLQRAARTCELAGFAKVAQVEEDLLEWNYGEYEGRRSAEIRAERPDWNLFRDGCPGGESVEQVGERANRVLCQIRAFQEDVLLFSSGHFLRVLAARWLGLEPAAGRFFLLSTASLSALSYEHTLSEPAIWLWDDSRHVVE